MAVEHHNLIHEFPEFRELIHRLKTENHHFRRLFDEYHKLTDEIENMENEVKPASTLAEEKAKLRRVVLKDELYAILKGKAEKL
ncbi:MAG: GTP-binding protein [Gammaproteobacteria bacterium]|nr:GTP-binding protein [Gammaproteobacteria bacterium]MAY01565.1 GTP-binding protein [Gammaproteobacteria bacterium]|tara:strand:- start:1035 stop:1286 length:252 start_codon:yes stop_codon:yes gene_type:complete